MADAMVAPDTVEFTVTGTSRARSTWLWARALLRKAQMGFVEGATRVRVAAGNALGTTAAAALAAGTQIALATRTGWNAGAKALTNVLGVVAKGALWVAKGISWAVDKIGGFFGWIVGLFHREAGQSVQNANANFTAWRNSKIEGGKARIEVLKHVAHAAMTTKTVSTVGRVAAGAMGLGTAANLATGGAVASYVATMPLIGPMAGAFFGPMGLLITGGIALLGGLFSWLFKKEEVFERMEAIETEALVKKYGVPEDGELIVNLVDDGHGGTKVTVKGHPVLVKVIKDDPALMAEVAEAAMNVESSEVLENRGPTNAKRHSKASASASA